MDLSDETRIKVWVSPIDSVQFLQGSTSYCSLQNYGSSKFLILCDVFNVMRQPLSRRIGRDEILPHGDV